MKMNKYYLALLLLCCSHMLFAQLERNSFRVGMNAAPLFELNSSGLNGGLLSVTADYSVTKRLSFSLQPYYAFTTEKTYYVFDLISQQPKDHSKDSFYSFGLNADIKILLVPGKVIKPYSSIMIGAGYSHYSLYERNTLGELVTNYETKFMNYNLGIGLGAYFQVSRSILIDTRIMYSEVSASKNIESSKYLYPVLGVVKSF